LTSRQYRFKARPWDLVRTPSVCNGCAVGCNVEVHSRTETVLRLVSRDNPEVDDGWLCDKGRFGTLPVNPEGRLAYPMMRQGGELTRVTLESALNRATHLPPVGGGTLPSAGLSNEAFWLLQQLSPKLSGALWPPQTSSWPVDGQIHSLLSCKSIVVVGLDVWNDLPVLALWMRKAVNGGAKLVVLGEHNGLWRATSHWLRGDPRALIPKFTEALTGSKKADPDMLAAAATMRGALPSALLVHPALDRAAIESLAAALDVNPNTGLVGAPLLGANGRGAQDFAPAIARGSAERVLERATVLAIGDEAWERLTAKRLIVASSRWLEDRPGLEVVLPIAHPYERQGSITNLEGRVQLQEGGAAPPPHARADWGLLGALAYALGLPAPDQLKQIRVEMAEQRPEVADMLRKEVLVARV